MSALKMYNTSKSWKENLIEGPLIHPSQEDFFTLACIKPRTYTFLGKEIYSRLGIASGPLLDSKWVINAADFGYDILTYKTIRSYYHEGHSIPNIIQLEDDGYTNYFGMPSMDKEYLCEDIKIAHEYLKNKGKILIISITGDSVDDFVNVASFAVNECQAEILEINLSCPNVDNRHLCLYKDIDAITKIIKAIRNNIGDSIPIIIKVGYFEDDNELENVLCTVSTIGVNAISGINGIPREVIGLRNHKVKTGVCGEPLLPYTIDFVSKARKIINDNELPIDIIAVGGVNSVHKINMLLEFGADVVQIASGFIMGNHGLALEYKNYLNN